MTKVAEAHIFFRDGRHVDLETGEVIPDAPYLVSGIVVWLHRHPDGAGEEIHIKPHDLRRYVEESEHGELVLEAVRRSLELIREAGTPILLGVGWEDLSEEEAYGGEGGEES